MLNDLVFFILSNNSRDIVKPERWLFILMILTVASHMQTCLVVCFFFVETKMFFFGFEIKVFE